MMGEWRNSHRLLLASRINIKYAGISNIFERRSGSEVRAPELAVEENG
jgi:hypothetical protein